MADSNHKKILNTYLRRLTNLSANNRSLLLLRLASDQFIDLHELSQLNGEKSFSIIESLITQSKKMICPVADARMEQVNEASKKLKRLQRIDHFIFDERGSKDLHVGWPFVEGKFNDGTPVRCPLLFFPVELKMEASRWVLHPREDSPVQFNKTFLLSYSFYNQVKADELLLEETFDESDQDSTVFRTQLYQILQKSSVEINFNPDTYRDDLISFPSLKKQEFEALHANGKLKLFPQAVMGIFPQAGSFLVPDYLQLLERDEFADLEGLFEKSIPPIQTDHGLNFLKEVKEDRVYPIFPMDSWQENALKGIKLGHSLVVQGPPGTGKSQLICNLISDGIALGKRILVVCQKRAALDVVYQRMQQENLSDFMALVHDFKNDRKEIFEKIARQINRVDEFRSKNNSLDTIHLERTFLQASRRIDQITEDLDAYRTALFDVTECGKSIKELYLNSSPEDPTINLKLEFQHFPFTHLDDFIRKMQAYCTYAHRFLASDYVLRDRKSFSAFHASDLHALKEILEEFPIIFSKVNDDIEKIIGVRLDWEQCVDLIEKKDEAAELITSIDRQPAYQFFQKMIAEPEEETSALWLSNLERVINECFLNEGAEVTVSTQQLGQLQEALNHSRKAKRNIISLIRWELFSKDKILIQRALIANGLRNDKQGFTTLEAKLDNRLNLEHNLSKLRAKAWLLDVPNDYVQDSYKNWFGQQLIAIHAKNIFSSIRGLKNLVDPDYHSRAEFKIKLKNLFESLAQIDERLNRWKNYFTVNQLSQLSKEKNLNELILKTIQRDFDSLCEFDRINETLKDEEKSTLQKLFEKEEKWNFDALKKLFVNSLSIAWIDHIENKHPELRMVSSDQLQLLESELREQILIKQRISAEMLLLKARERVIADLEFNRLNNRVTYRDLLHQVTKKKKIWPIRKVIGEFENEVYKLLPCWLASPESVSALFPLSESFDLVIFDEASQCFSERGIPALYRGKQAVVAGDSKQLRPGDFYQVRWQDESDEPEPDLEVDSLLELASRYWPSLQLRGHYRSKATELIDFSNHHFYDGSLQLLPDFKLDRSTPVIEYLKVDGTWINNTNLVEAAAVAACIEKLLADTPDLQIGVVTFNAPQQMLIMDVLEEEFGKRHQPIPTTIFIKNIENVQGDESDVIIFSVGYAADPSGKVNAQFGSLSQAGGENRLNVAITRARKKIIVITSLWPHQLEISEAKNEGPRLFKKYLQFAQEVSDKKYRPSSAVLEKHEQSWYLNPRIISWAKQKWPDHGVENAAMPFFDLIVKQKEEPCGVLLSDDEFYFQSLSARAPHGLTPLLLDQKSWPFIRVHSRTYWQDRERFFNEVSKLFVNRD